jgi:hypothetical protein
MRIKLIFLVVMACQAALFLGAASPLSWWDGL